MDALAGRLRAVPTGLAHGTVTAIVERRRFEITTLRRDVETDGRHAVVAFTDDWQADAARRDFTFNAMSLSQDGVVHDYFGGRADLRAGRVRFVGDPATRIAEDRLRLLRFFRFFARYGREPPAVEVGGRSPRRRRASRPVGGAGVGELRQILAAPDPRGPCPDGAAWRAGGGDSGGRRPCPAGASGAAGAPADPLLRLAALLKATPARLRRG